MKILTFYPLFLALQKLKSLLILIYGGVVRVHYLEPSLIRIID